MISQFVWAAILLSVPSFAENNRIQAAADAAFAGRDGTAVVMSVETGRVVASHRRDYAERMAARPGSVIKPFILETLRAHNAAGGRLACPGRLRIGSKQVDCTHPPLNELVDARRAIAYSCNNWFAESSRRIGAPDIEQALLRFGFTRVQRAETDDAKRLQALGEAGVQVTPLELAKGYRTLALRGDLNAELAGAAEFGTAQLAEPLGSHIAAKTGTTSDGAWIAGWAPAEKPRYVVVVFVPGGSGGSDAAPVARQIFAALEIPDPHGVRVQVGSSVFDLPLEEYVAGVVAGEGSTMGNPDSMRAMAVTARTWASAERGRHRKEGFDFCSTTHCQEYRPLDVSQKAVAAVRGTAGELLWWQGRPALAYYSRDCGGTTEAGSAVWPELDAPYLTRHEDPWCQSRGRNEWQASVAKTEIGEALVREGLIRATRIDTVRVASRTKSGRVAEVMAGNTTMRATAFRFALGRQLGWNLVRSDLYDIANTGSDINFWGSGAGHGAGMCQVGAAQMGEKGHTYREILAFYYPGTVLSRSAYGLAWQALSGEKVRVITTLPQQDGSLVQIADALVGWAERRTGLRFRSSAQVQVYPTVPAFRDATGEPGWVGGSTQGGVIRLQPHPEEAVIRHEMLHELVEQNAAPGLPLWFREGLVLYLQPGAASTSAPKDAAAVYAGYRRRVQALVAQHGEGTVLSWIRSGAPRGIAGPTPPIR